MQNFHKLVTNTVKSLSLSAIEKSGSGHTSFPLGMADVGYSLFFKHMRYNPKDAKWINRDRLILSSGHGSMFLYSYLHLLGYDISLDDIKNFRQIDSKTPGHPEFGHTEGVESTTGPLGQGFANAVGVALAEEMSGQMFNTENFDLINHYTFCLLGDGDLMEGVAMEAASFAGHHNLKKLICIYDDNKITIDGKTDITYSDDVAKKFEAQNWHIQTIDGHNIEEIDTAIENAKNSDKPSLIIAQTISGKGAVNWEGTNKIHGNPMKEEDYKVSYEALGVPPFTVSDEVYAFAVEKRKEEKQLYKSWANGLKEWHTTHPELAEKLHAFVENDTTHAIDALDRLELNEKAATRVLSGKVINEIAEFYPQLVGGSADLAGSNNTTMTNYEFIGKSKFDGRNIHYGIREHAMGAIMNGISYHGILRPYGATFLVFSDYLRPAIRIAALANLPAIYVFTHDSFYVGEDGPTHHPVEQISSLRLVPNLVTIRPADGAEVIGAWKYILKQENRPVALFLTRQAVEPIPREENSDNLEKGAYILKDSEESPELIVMASGSEVSLVFHAVAGLPMNKKIRVISFPSTEIFEEQNDEYKEKILPSSCTKRFAIEAGKTDLWYKYTGFQGKVFGLDTFSKSAPANDLAKDFGFTVANIKKEIEEYFNN